MIWFVRIRLDSAVEEELATELSRSFGQTYVENGRNLTEITFDTVHSNIAEAINKSINSVQNFISLRKSGIYISRVEVMTREERLEMLKDAGITEENTMPNIS